VLAPLIAIALLPSPALAATGADYTTQAEAQRRDVDLGAAESHNAVGPEGRGR